MINKIKNIKLSKKQQTIIILGSIFIMMLVLNLLTPLIADDYSYSLNLDNTKINSFMDVINYQWWHYFNWGGRTIAHTIAQVFLLFPKYLFSIINPLIYIALIYLMYLHIRGNREDKPLYLLIIHLALWFLLPVFGQTCLWLIGSCNYLWTTVLILWFLWIYRKNTKDISKLKILGLFFLGILAGWTNENTAAGLVIILIGYLIIQKLENKNNKISKLQIIGLIGVLLGFALMILAPGNYIRNEEFQDNTFIIIKLIKRAVEITLSAENYLLPIIIGIVVLISIKVYYKKKVEKDSWVFIAGGISTAYAMILSPTFPERAWTGVIIFLVIAAGCLLYDLEKINKAFKFIIIDACIILFIIYIGQYISAGIDINNLRNTWESRIEIINKEKNKGNKNVVIDPFTTWNTKNPIYGLSDISTDSKVWPNTSIAKYYGLKSIKTREITK